MTAGIIETAAFGFLDEVQRERETWVGLTRRPFRGQTLWLFGDPGAVLVSLQIGVVEQLTVPLPFDRFVPSFGIADVRRLVADGDAMHIVNRRCQSVLNYSPRITLPTQSPGMTLRLGTTGLVGGVLLVGEQLP